MQNPKITLLVNKLCKEFIQQRSINKNLTLHEYLAFLVTYYDILK